MKHRVTFTFKPVVLEVETFSGKDVAEELARHLLRAKIEEGSTPIWMADCSHAAVEPLAARTSANRKTQCDCTTINFHGHPCGAPATVNGLCSSCYRNCLPGDAAE